MNNISVFIFVILIIQIALMMVYEMSYLSISSLLKNLLFGIIIFSVFVKYKKGSAPIFKKLKPFYKNYLLLIIIPMWYAFQYAFIPTYIGQDIVALPATIPAYYFVHLDKLQDEHTIHNDYLHVLKPNLKDGGNNLWYQYTHYQIGDYTYYIIFTSISKLDPMITLWFHYANNKTKESYHYNEKFDKNNYITKIRENKDLLAHCKTDNFNFRYKVNNYEKEYFVSFELYPKNLNLVYNGYIQSDYNQFAGRVFPFKLLNPIIPALDGQITDNTNESFNDQLIITKGTSTINGIFYDDCTNWQDCQNGIDTYFMTTWLWIYERSENFCIYTLWYSDPEYYNDDTTLRVMYIYDIKNNKVILNGCSFMKPQYKMLTGFYHCDINTKGTSVKDKAFEYERSIKCQNFTAYIESIPNTSIKVCNDKYMYQRTDKSVDYGKMEKLMQVMEQIRYDEFSNQSILKINYNGKEYIEKAKVIVDSMTWKNCWPYGYPRRNSSFFEKIFKLN